MIECNDTNHKLRINAVQEQLAYFRKRKEKFRIYHGNTNTTRNNKKDPTKLLDISGLTEILEINIEDGYVIAEANVPMDALLDATLAKGFVPQVVPEFPSITIGGAVQGGAGESSSFKYGCVHSACIEYEILLADGKLMSATSTQNTDLFDSIAGSYGSIGIITAVKMNIIPAAPYIKLSYHPVASYAEAILTIKAMTTEQNDFVDGIMYSKTMGVIMKGTFSSEALPNHTTLHRSTDDWFYIHAKQNISNNTVYEDTVPTKDYFFRYDRGAFWVGSYGFHMFHIPYNRLTRILFARLLGTRTLYPFLEGAKLSQGYIIQDICLPADNAEALMQYNEAHLNIFPLWLCPLKPDVNEYLSPTYLRTAMVINIGIWGKLDVEYKRFVEINRALESKTRDLGGRKVLYAHAYYTLADFWEIYNQKRYREIRSKYNAMDIFPDIYTKTHVADKYTPSILKGVLNMLKASLK